LETDIRYYRRRAYEELSAASRAITPAAQERRLHLVGVYLDHLKALNAPSPFDEQKLTGLLKDLAGKASSRSAFGWTESQVKSEHA
jgi:hypothetical protein